MKAILFDRGNTLVQFGESDYEAGLKEILGSLDSPETLNLAELHRFEDEFFAKIDFYRERAHLEVNLLHYYELLARYFGVRFNQPYEEICRRYHLAAQRISPITGASHVLDELKRRGYFLGLVTNTSLPHSVVKAEFDQFSLFDYFDTVVCSSEIVFRKPDAAMFEVALRSLNVKPGEALFVGDDYHADIIGAKNAGMKAVWMNPSHHPNPGEVAPDYTISGLEEILQFSEIDGK